MSRVFYEEFSVISHRGASYYEPENTMRAFEKSVALGFKTFEFDVRKTKDDHLVVIHDRSVNRTTDGKGLVRSKTLEQIRLLDAGKGEKIPLLEEVLSSFKGRVKFVIELKEKGVEKETLTLINKYNLRDDVFIVSFKKDCLKKIRLLDSEVFTGLITVFGSLLVKNAVKCGCNAVATNHYFATQRKINDAHANNLLYFCWTVNDRRKGEKLKKMGVNGILSDVPDEFSYLLK